MEKFKGVKNDSYYVAKLKSKMAITICIVIVGSLLLGIVLYIINREMKFFKAVEKTPAKIIEMQEGEEVKVEFYIDGVKHIGTISERHSSMRVGQTIEIYYKDSYIAKYVGVPGIMAIGLVIYIAIGFFGVITELKNVIRYIQTLNGVEIKAEIIRVIPVVKSWGTEYKIECKGKDEDGNERTFYSRNFREYIESEIKAINMETVTVRYKKHDPEKYIVLTEELEMRLYL